MDIFQIFELQSFSSKNRQFLWGNRQNEQSAVLVVIVFLVFCQTTRLNDCVMNLSCLSSTLTNLTCQTTRSAQLRRTPSRVFNRWLICKSAFLSHSLPGACSFEYLRVSLSICSWTCDEQTIEPVFRFLLDHQKSNSLHKWLSCHRLSR